MSAEFFESAMRVAARRRMEHVRYEAELLVSLCKSPIEQKLAASLFATDAATLCFSAVLTVEGPEGGGHGFYVWPQMPVLNYRADFGLIFLAHTGKYRLVVECDGHDFHEKTKEQAAHDKARDRAFLDAGWPVMRFTGSEIHRDSLKCADQAGDFLMRQMMDDHRKLRESLS